MNQRNVAKYRQNNLHRFGCSPLLWTVPCLEQPTKVTIALEKVREELVPHVGDLSAEIDAKHEAISFKFDKWWPGGKGCSSPDLSSQANSSSNSALLLLRPSLVTPLRMELLPERGSPRIDLYSPRLDMIATCSSVPAISTSTSCGYNAAISGRYAEARVQRSCKVIGLYFKNRSHKKWYFGKSSSTMPECAHAA